MNLTRKHLKFGTSLLSLSAWMSLGGYRGYQEYNREYKKDCKRYAKHEYGKKPQYYYVSVVGFVLKNILFCYMNPILFIPCVIDESYNLERKIRGIEEDDD
jgi:hypothetical protein